MVLFGLFNWVFLVVIESLSFDRASVANISHPIKEALGWHFTDHCVDITTKLTASATRAHAFSTFFLDNTVPAWCYFTSESRFECQLTCDCTTFCECDTSLSFRAGCIYNRQFVVFLWLSLPLPRAYNCVSDILESSACWWYWLAGNCKGKKK